MSKALKAYKRLRNNIRLLEENTSLKYFFENDEFHFREDLDIIETALEQKEKLERATKIIEDEKKLKALEIIKRELRKHNIDISGIICHKEEYDLVKEVLL